MPLLNGKMGPPSTSPMILTPSYPPSWHTRTLYQLQLPSKVAYWMKPTKIYRFNKSFFFVFTSALDISHSQPFSGSEEKVGLVHMEKQWDVELFILLNVPPAWGGSKDVHHQTHNGLQSIPLDLSQQTNSNLVTWCLVISISPLLKEEPSPLKEVSVSRLLVEHYC